MFESEIEEANKIVSQKMNELQIACDMLAMWKTKSALAYNAMQIKAVPKEELPATAKASKTIRYKRTGYTVATTKRRKSFLLFVKSRLGKAPSFEDVANLVVIAYSEKATFKWCKGLSNVSILGLYQYCKNNF